jgi:hypothetical protein
MDTQGETVFSVGKIRLTADQPCWEDRVVGYLQGLYCELVVMSTPNPEDPTLLPNGIGE